MLLIILESRVAPTCFSSHPPQPYIYVYPKLMYSAAMAIYTHLYVRRIILTHPTSYLKPLRKSSRLAIRISPTDRRMAVVSTNNNINNYNNSRWWVSDALCCCRWGDQPSHQHFAHLVFTEQLPSKAHAYNAPCTVYAHSHIHNSERRAFIYLKKKSRKTTCFETRSYISKCICFMDRWHIYISVLLMAHFACLL